MAENVTALPREVKLSDFAGQGALYEGLMRTLADGTYVHAYLITGPEGIGKRTLAHLMAQHLLCTGEAFHKPCGVCPACLQVMSGNHPDVLEVAVGGPLATPEDIKNKSKVISVGQIRNAMRLISQHTFTGGNKVVIVHDAEKMRQEAANAFLKTLEEPPAGTVFLLLTDAPELLLDTIVSRCRAMKMRPWADVYIRQVLMDRGVMPDVAQRAVMVCGGSIGKALSIAGDEEYWAMRDEVMRDFFALPSRGEILRVSTAWKDRKDDAGVLLNDLEDMVRTLLLVRLGQQDASLLDDYPEPWQKMAASADLAAFIGLMDAIGDARRLRLNQVTWQAALEKLLLRMMEEKSKWST